MNIPAWQVPFNGLLELLYPPGVHCVACRRKLAGEEEWLLCEECADALIPVAADAVCVRCGHPGAGLGCLHCLTEQVAALGTLYAAFLHDEAARGLVHALKYDCLREAAGPLADGMAGLLDNHCGAWDVLVPIPLHWRKLRKRGFNQAMALAEALGKRCGLPAREMLRRVTETKQQAVLDADARHENMREAFAPAAPMTGLRVLLVDDVRSTGATAENAARACQAAGAVRVGLITATAAM